MNNTGKRIGPGESERARALFSKSSKPADNACKCRVVGGVRGQKTPAYFDRCTRDPAKGSDGVASAGCTDVVDIAGCDQVYVLSLRKGLIGGGQQPCTGQRHHCRRQ
ncbi:hypothetical protein GCM10009093_25200 [Brevundimonas terrae]|uniref:Uncharacterized protein n=1 Tax=Brevundimonas terrae TaxID=363631 RepID=A0ABP3ID50_9CAUL